MQGRRAFLFGSFPTADAIAGLCPQGAMIRLSLMVTTTERPLLLFVTFTCDQMAGCRQSMSDSWLGNLRECLGSSGLKVQAAIEKDLPTLRNGRRASRRSCRVNVMRGSAHARRGDAF